MTGFYVGLFESEIARFHAGEILHATNPTMTAADNGRSMIENLGDSVQYFFDVTKGFMG